MGLSWISGAAAALGLVFAASAAEAVVIYDDNATDPLGVYNGTGAAIVVPFTTGTTGPAAFSFELFGARSIDGDGNCCTDVFILSLNGTDIFRGSFNMSGGGTEAEYVNLAGLGWKTTTNPGDNFQGGKTLFSGALDLLLGANTLSFRYSPLQGAGDESFAINDVDVAISAVPLPAALPLLAGALAGLGGLGLRRRRKTA
jgi:hypothetical protein